MTTATDSIQATKQDLLQATSNLDEFLSILSRLNAKELKNILEFFWDFIVKNSKDAPTKYTNNDLQSQLEPLSKYQQRVKCQEPLGYCTVSMCVRVNPDCAVQRITGILKSIFPLLQNLVKEKPECLNYQFNEEKQENPEIIAKVPPTEEIASSENELESPLTIDENPVPPLEETNSSTETESKAENAETGEDITENYARFKELLWSMVEFEGLDHAFLQTRSGQVLQFASSSRTDYQNIAGKISTEIESVIEQGEAANYTELLTVIKEYSRGVLAIRAIVGDIYLVGVSETVLPGKIHSLIVKLGNMLKSELN